ncbi:hypothetical protein EDB87DRAFT_629456 [Lactarius vividus]|nr:hypothetical protein EDB87DRAFT_629456 [Lactarius vividus]
MACRIDTLGPLLSKANFVGSADLPIFLAGGDRVQRCEGRRHQILNRPQACDQARIVRLAGQPSKQVYGSPKSDPENPLPGPARTSEPLLLLELDADLYPDSGLLPKDPVE